MADGPLGGARGETRRRPSGLTPIMLPSMLMTTCGRARRTIGRVQFGAAGGKRSLKTQKHVGRGAEGRVEGGADGALVPAGAAASTIAFAACATSSSRSRSWAPS